MDPGFISVLFNPPAFPKLFFIYTRGVHFPLFVSHGIPGDRFTWNLLISVGQKNPKVSPKAKAMYVEEEVEKGSC